MTSYSQQFYTGRHDKTIYSARSILPLVLDKLPPINSMIDVGCGVGTWLLVAKEMGIENILGLEGDWVDENLLKIPQNCFTKIDLSQPVNLPQKYDLAISLEVAEHLPGDSAIGFVSSLTKLSDFILFSAAIPFQGGRKHINEQWPHYWFNLFKAQSYVCYDFIRPEIWNEEGIPIWYKQNMLFFVKRERISDITLNTSSLENGDLPLSIIHPDLYLEKAIETSQMLTIKGGGKIFWRALKHTIKYSIKKNNHK